MNLEQLMKKLGEVTAQANARMKPITDEKRAATADEQQAIDADVAQIAELRKQIDAAKAAEAKLEEQRKAIADAATMVNTTSRKSAEAPQPSPTPEIEVVGHEARYGKLKAFKDEKSALHCGHLIRGAFLGANAGQRTLGYLSKRGIDFRAMSESVNSGGGFLVPDEFSNAIVDLRETYGVFRRECRVLPMSRDTITIARRAGGVTAYFTAEGAAITSSDKSFDAVQLTTKKLAALTYLSTELAEDAIINVADDIAQEMAYAFALKEDQCGFNGDGTSTYGGITGVTAKILGLAGAVDAASGHDTFAEIDATDLSTLMGKLPQYARTGAKWYCSQVAYDLVFSRLAFAAGGNTVQNINGAFGPSYYGYPIVVSQVLPTATTDISDTAMLLFGRLDLAATLGERRGVTIARSNEIKFVEDQIAIKATERIDINVHDVGDASTAGPIVALIGE